jgi:hypothetical protein
VITGSRGTLFKYKPVKLGSIEPVHRGPAVVPVAYIRRDALLTRMPMRAGMKP